MKYLTKKQKLIVIFVILLFSLTILGTIALEHLSVSSGENDTVFSNAAEDDTKGTIDFSLSPGFYSQEQALTLSAPGAVQILYTLDGTNPEKGGTPYTDAIQLACKEDASAYTVSACAVYEDGTVSDPEVCSYFVSEEINDRFDCLVFSITIDPHHLYNYENGLFIAGKARDDYLAANPHLSEEDLDPPDPANWNQSGKASERDAYVEVYESNGSCVISQPCGFRIFGGWSRDNDQKNIRLFARSEYDVVDNRFRYEFFPDAKNSIGQRMTSYKRVSLRASGNDYAIRMREDIISYLTHDIGIEAKYSRPAAVFLNGEYYGFAWCQQVFNGDLLDHKYHLEESEWDILFGDGNGWLEEDPENAYWEDAANSWLEVCDYAYMDLIDDVDYATLCSKLDIDNFLKYYALNAYIGNRDWPCNNIKMFRYSVERNTQVNAAFTSEKAKNICDGRWRFFSYDTDFGLGLGDDPNTLLKLFDEQFFGLPADYEMDDMDAYRRSDLLMALCKREDVREKFLTIMCDIINWHFQADRTAAAINNYHNWRLNEYTAASEVGLVVPVNIDGELEYAINWNIQRPATIFQQISDIFPEYTDKILLKTAPVVGASIQINTISLNEEDGCFEGQYYSGTDIPISCIPAYGYEFDYWEINGEREERQSFLLNSENYTDSTLELTLHLKQADKGIRISEVCYKGSMHDYFVITNYSTVPLSTFGLSMWDGGEQDPFFLPKMVLDPGESQKFVCRNYRDIDAIGLLEAPFNLKEGELLTIYDSAGNVIQELMLQDSSDDSILKFNIQTSRFEEYAATEIPYIPGMS